MTTAVLVIAAVALLLAAVALALSVNTRHDAKATRNELARHRYSHTLGQPDSPARRHSENPGPAPRVEEDAAPATGVIPAQPGPTLPPPGTRPRVREDPQA